MAMSVTPETGPPRDSGVSGIEEFDGEARRGLWWLDEVLDVGRNALGTVEVDDGVGDRLGASNEAERSAFDEESTPRSGRHPVGAPQCRGHRLVIPRRRGPHHGQAGGALAS